VLLSPCPPPTSRRRPSISTKLARKSHPGAHAVLVCDGAAWHQTGGRLIVPQRITLSRLPAYAAELNSTENVWEYLPANKVSHPVRDRYDGIDTACREGWNVLINAPDRIRSIVIGTGHRSMSMWAGIRLLLYLASLGEQTKRAQSENSAASSRFDGRVRVRLERS
jgi:hypothetical protein